MSLAAKFALILLLQANFKVNIAGEKLQNASSANADSSKTENLSKSNDNDSVPQNTSNPAKNSTQSVKNLTKSLENVIYIFFDPKYVKFLTKGRKRR